MDINAISMHGSNVTSLPSLALGTNASIVVQCMSASMHHHASRHRGRQVRKRCEWEHACVRVLATCPRVSSILLIRDCSCSIARSYSANVASIAAIRAPHSSCSLTDWRISAVKAFTFCKTTSESVNRESLDRNAHTTVMLHCVYLLRCGERSLQRVYFVLDRRLGCAAVICRLSLF